MDACRRCDFHDQLGGRHFDFELVGCELGHVGSISDTHFDQVGQRLELDINRAVRETYQANTQEIETYRDDEDCFVEFKKAVIFGKTMIDQTSLNCSDEQPVQIPVNKKEEAFFDSVPNMIDITPSVVNLETTRDPDDENYHINCYHDQSNEKLESEPLSLITYQNANTINNNLQQTVYLKCPEYENPKVNPEPSRNNAVEVQPCYHRETQG